MLHTPKDGPLDRPIAVTLFPDKSGYEKEEQALSLRQLAKIIKHEVAPSRDEMRLLKLATFGDTPIGRKSLRTNDNVLTLTGVELDYDEGEVAFVEARDLLISASVACILYTSRSYTPDIPKWRILALLGTPVDDPKDFDRVRHHMLGRLAGIFRQRCGYNPFDYRSWVLSQSYFFGAVEGASHHQTIIINGHPIDDSFHDDLDQTAFGKPHAKDMGKDSKGRTIIDERAPNDWEVIYADLAAGKNFHGSINKIIGRLVTKGWPRPQIVDRVETLLDESEGRNPKHKRHKRWKQIRNSPREIRDLLDFAFSRDRDRGPFSSAAEDDAPWVTDDDDPSHGEETIEEEAAQEQEKKAEGPSGRLLLSSAEFIAGWRPPVYTVDGILQSDFIYSLTAPTSHGKTALALYLAYCIALGKPFHGHPVEQGSVLFCAGENPADIMARYMVMADQLSFDPSHPGFHFINGVVDLKRSLARIRKEALDIPDLRLAIVDTAAAYFDGDNQNDNAQAIAYGRTLRQLTTLLPHHPTVIANCHPKKGAGREDLIPMGGSAFLNEIDGNVTLWKDADENLTLGRHGKFRGPEFSDLRFKLEAVSSPKVVDAKGREIPSIMARPLGFIEAEADDEQATTDRRMLLSVIHHNASLTLRQIAEKLQWTTKSGSPDHSRVARKCRGLETYKLLYRDALSGRWKLTEAGRKAIGVKDENT